MGTITGLLLLPFMAPVWGFRFLLERIRDEAEAVLRDEGRAFAELIDLSMRHTTGQLTDAEYAEQETQLLERLNSIREYRHELLHTPSAADDEVWSLQDEPSEDGQDEGDSFFAELDEDEEER
jgi:hypothetical protein